MGQEKRTFFGLGIYSVPEAARLTGIESRTIRRWVRGYDYRVGEKLLHSPEVINADLPQFEGVFALSFRDLIEVRFVNAFRQYDVSWKTLRAAGTARTASSKNHTSILYQSLSH